MKPVEIGGKFHLYRPVEIPPIPKPKLKNLMGDYLTEEYVNNEKQKIVNEAESLEKSHDEITNKKSQLASQYTSGDSYDEAARRKELNNPILTNPKLLEILKTLTPNPGNPKNKRSIIDRIINEEKKQSPNNILQKIKNLDLEQDLMRNTYRDLETKYEALDADYELQKRIEDENKLKLIEYENTKRQVAEEALSDFNRLNQGKTQVVRQSNETDEDFIQRLKDMGNIFVDPADMEKQIQTEILMKAKKNLLELTNDYDKAESVLRMLNNDERFQMNKTFPQIKKKYSDAFGLNNKDLDDVEMTQFIKNEVEKSQSLITPKTLEPGPEPAPVEIPSQEAIPSDEAIPVPDEEQGLPTTKITVRELKLYTKLKSNIYPNLNLKMHHKKSDLIRQLVNAGFWDENDIYGYLDYLKNQPLEAQIAEAQIAEPIINLPPVPSSKPKQAPNDSIFDLPATPNQNTLPEEFDFNDYLRQVEIGADKGAMSGVGLKSQVLPQKFIIKKQT